MTMHPRRPSHRQVPRPSPATANADRAPKLSFTPREETIAAITRLARLTVAGEPGGFESSLVVFTRHHGLSIEDPAFANLLLELIEKRQRILAGQEPEDAPAKLTSMERGAAAYALFLAIKDLPERQPIEHDLQQCVGALKTRPTPNSILHLCLRAIIGYKKVSLGGKTSTAQYWQRDGLAFRYLMRNGVTPSQLGTYAKLAGQSIKVWASAQSEYERGLSSTTSGSEAAKSTSPIVAVKEPQPRRLTITVELDSPDEEVKTWVYYLNETDCNLLRMMAERLSKKHPSKR